MESMLLVSKRGGFARPVRIETIEPYPCSQYVKTKDQNILKQAKDISIEDSSNRVNWAISTLNLLQMLLCIN